MATPALGHASAAMYLFSAMLTPDAHARVPVGNVDPSKLHWDVNFEDAVKLAFQKEIKRAKEACVALPATTPALHAFVLRTKVAAQDLDPFLGRWEANQSAEFIVKGVLSNIGDVTCCKATLALQLPPGASDLGPRNVCHRQLRTGKNSLVNLVRFARARLDPAGCSDSWWFSRAAPAEHA